MTGAAHLHQSSSMFNVGGGLEGYDCDPSDNQHDEDKSSSTMLLSNMAPSTADYAGGMDARDRCESLLPLITCTY